MKIGDFVGRTKVTPELLADLRTKKEKQDMYKWLVEENKIALKVAKGLIPDPDDGEMPEIIQMRKSWRANYIEFIELILGDEFQSVKEKFPAVFSLETCRIFSGLNKYTQRTAVKEPWLQVVEY